MKRSNLFIAAALILIVSELRAQHLNQPTGQYNYYEYIGVNLDSSTLATDTAEGSVTNRLYRESLIWAPRLYPQGDFGVAKTALNSAISNFPYTKINYSPQWKYIGPEDTLQVAAKNPKGFW